MNQNNDDFTPVVYNIPQNYNEPVNILTSLFTLSNLIQAGVVGLILNYAIEALLFLIAGLFNRGWISFQVELFIKVIIILPIVIIFAIGVNGESIVKYATYAFNFFYAKKTNKATMRYERIDLKYLPEKYEERKEKNLALAKNINTSKVHLEENALERFLRLRKEKKVQKNN